MKGKYFVLLAGLAWCAVLATTAGGCGGGIERDARRAAQLIEEQVLRVGNGAEPEGLDPHLVTGVPEHHILISIFEGLVNADPKDLSPIPGVAESWEVSEDGKVYTFRIGRDRKWSNGDPITAHDFLYAWRRMLTPTLAGEYAYMLWPMKNARAYNEGQLTDFSQVGARAIDDYTLEVTLEHPIPYFLSLHIHYSWFPVHRPTIEKFGKIDERNTRWTRPENIVGNGPFVLTRWEPNNVIETRKNEHYWDAANVSLKGVNFYPVPLEQTEERMFRAGELHITENVPVAKIPVYREKAPQYLRTDPWIGSYFYRVNTKRPPLDDKRVRQALAMALDRNAITQHILKAGEQPAPYLTPPGMGGYVPRAGVEYNVERAKELLAEAGYPGGQGMRSIDILYNTNEAHRKIAEAIQQMWKRDLGINVTLTNQDWKVYLESTANNVMDFDLARAGWIGDFVDPVNFLECFTTGNGNNRTGWSSPEYDALIAKSFEIKDPAERNEVFQQAEAILVDEAPIIPIYIYTKKFLIAPEVKGFQSNILNYMPYHKLRLEAGDTQALPPQTEN